MSGPWSVWEDSGRVLAEIAASTAVALGIYFAIGDVAPDSHPVSERIEIDATAEVSVPAAAEAENVDTAAARHGAGAAALMALPYAGWDDNADDSLLGVTALDEDRAWPGFNLYTNEENEVHLLDMTGRRVHTWTLARRFVHCELPELLGSGELLVVCVGQALVRVDWHSNVVWRKRLNVHHDVAVDRDGSILVLYEEPERMYQGHRVTFDGIARLSAEGEFLDKWSMFQDLEALRKWHPASKLDTPAAGDSDDVFDYYHVNSLEVLPPTPLGEKDPRFRAGNLLVCLRNVNVVAVLDQDTREVLWTWGAGELDFPHMPTLLENGHLLVFDNGLLRGYTRVLEVDVATGEIVWRHQGEPPEEFYSKWRGSNQRLANGNTLICESEKGHAFEVTREGEVVWEFWNPDVENGRRRRIYRFMRVGEDRLREIRRSVGGIR